MYKVIVASARGAGLVLVELDKGISFSKSSSLGAQASARAFHEVRGQDDLRPGSGFMGLGELWASLLGLRGALGFLNRELGPWYELELGPHLFGRAVAALGSYCSARVLGGESRFGKEKLGQAWGREKLGLLVFCKGTTPTATNRSGRRPTYLRGLSLVECRHGCLFDPPPPRVFQFELPNFPEFEREGERVLGFFREPRRRYP
ncbi:unnamed protein product [Prunus brigantina]